VFSVFSFQFQQNKFYPNTHLIIYFLKSEKNLWWKMMNCTLRLPRWKLECVWGLFGQLQVATRRKLTEFSWWPGLSWRSRIPLLASTYATTVWVTHQSPKKEICQMSSEQRCFVGALEFETFRPVLRKHPTKWELYYMIHSFIFN